MKKILLFALFICFVSCAPLGTSYKSYNEVDFSTINKIGIIITKVDYRDAKFGEAVESMFVENLKTSLSNVHGKETVFLGYANEVMDKGEDYMKDQPVDAIIHCEIDINGMLTLDNSNRYNTTVRTQLFKVPEKVLIADSKFNTNLGKSYARHPLLEEAIKDGVEGAIKPLGKINNNSM
jgi:hypothetical protein